MSYLLAFFGGFFIFPLMAAMLICLWIAFLLWKEKRPVEEPEEQPDPGTFSILDTSRVVALIDQVDTMIKRLDDAEMDEVIQELQKRRW